MIHARDLEGIFQARDLICANTNGVAFEQVRRNLEFNGCSTIDLYVM